METTLLLSRFWGILLLAGIGGWVLSMVFSNNPNSIFKQFAMDRGLILISGFMTLALGAAAIALHNKWGTTHEITVTLFGWITLLKGITRVGFPEIVMNYAQKMQNNKTVTAIPIAIGLGVGSYLLYVGMGY